MQGDKILVHEKHRRAAAAVAEILLPRLVETEGIFAVSIGGESGSGKSELAVALAEVLERHGIDSLIIQQDDYFVYPPRTNDAKRREDISHVGVSEVRLALLDDHIQAIRNGAETVEKPLVVYQDDRITRETLLLNGVDVVIVEGTYTTLLKNVHSRIFIDQTYKQTRLARLKRNRELPDPFLERVLEIEHEIISAHKCIADIIVTKSFTVATQTPRGEPRDLFTDHERFSKEAITGNNSHSERP